MNTGGGGLSLLHGIFLTQESNWGLLHFRRILYQLSCQGSPRSEESESHSVMSDSLQPHELYSPWDSPGQNSEMGGLSLLQGIFPTQGSSLGKPKNTGMGSLSLLHQVFLTQESNWGLLH